MNKLTINREQINELRALYGGACKDEARALMLAKLNPKSGKRRAEYFEAAQRVGAVLDVCDVLGIRERITGEDEYTRGKEKARREAQEWQERTAQTAQSWEGIAAAGAYFERLGRRYGLTREFRENGII